MVEEQIRPFNEKAFSVNTHLWLTIIFYHLETMTFIKKLWVNINGRDVQRKNVVNNVDKSSLWAPWQNGPYKTTQYITKHWVYKDATDIKK